MQTPNFRRLHAIVALLAAAFTAHGAEQPRRPEYLASYDPAKGFKPAQRDLTEIFLQLAGSIEAHGSPVPYLKHVAVEHSRIESLYRRKFGKEPKSFRPAYMTDAYLDKLAANWNLLSPKIGLEPYAKDVGHMMRDGIKGTRGTGTIAVAIFNEHQTLVMDEMVGKGKEPAGFERLKTQIISRLELNNLDVDEWGFEIARRDAVTYALGIHGVTMKLFDRVNGGLDEKAAAAVKTYLTSVIMDAGRAAQSELQAGIAEWADAKQSATTK